MSETFPQLEEMFDLFDHIVRSRHGVDFDTPSSDKKQSKNGKPSKNGHDRVLKCELRYLVPCEENNAIYNQIRDDDPATIALAESIKKQGILEPIVITRDRVIISGHRRHTAARLAGLTSAPVRVEPIDYHTKDAAERKRFLACLREYNRHREKTRAEKLREEIASTNPDDAYDALMSDRIERSKVKVKPVRIYGRVRRNNISEAKQPMLDAILQILEERRIYWPLTDRGIHYGLLNDPPLKHASKPDSFYLNDIRSYKNLVDLLTRARLLGIIPFEAIADETRPVTTWDVHQSPTSFIRQGLDSFLTNYWRDLMQSQPNHIELLGEKNTVDPILRRVASKYCIPLTTGRGYSSLPPRKAMADRFIQSGREKLILVVASDCDPDGDEICHSFARSMRDDFGIQNIYPIKAALTREQVLEMKLPPVMKAKRKSANLKKYIKRYGTDDVYELEAIPPQTLEEIVSSVIKSVIDVDAYNAEVEEERKDAAFISATRINVLEALKEADIDSLLDEDKA